MMLGARPGNTKLKATVSVWKKNPFVHFPQISMKRTFPTFVPPRYRRNGVLFFLLLQYFRGVFLSRRCRKTKFVTNAPMSAADNRFLLLSSYERKREIKRTLCNKATFMQLLCAENFLSHFFPRRIGKCARMFNQFHLRLKQHLNFSFFLFVTSKICCFFPVVLEFCQENFSAKSKLFCTIETSH